MRHTPFALERYFARHEFSARYLLSSSDCNGPTMAELVSGADPELRRLWDGLTLGYTEPTGHPLLREEIARLYAGVSPAEVIELVPEEAIFAFMHTLLDRADHVVSMQPAYGSLYQLALDLGCEVDCWMPREHKASWHFDPDELARLVRPHTRLVILNFPHNPTGAYPTRAELEHIVRIVRASGATLFSDEMYRFLEPEGTALLPSAIEIYERAVVLGGMSKSFGLAGLRVGWLASHDAELRARLASTKDYLTICGSAPSELLALMALRNRGAILQQHRHRIRANARHFQAFLAERAELFSGGPPSAGPVCFVRLLGEPSAQAFADRAVAEAGVMMAPSLLFGYGDHHIRVGLGRSNLPEVLAELCRYLDQRSP